ncbi:Aste57867_21324 [Aphanomyces stellatus]|uniref:Aste57867_21324 protein n=1 Tax=Aphanomyces stellatus TaxID=120398 RepID=A0A485LHW8_9STRA|nr:hypothetical protein As57867_021255 [Aphanomyces stellatus]VFT97996.1 Aste57867_21324 [Aphanomyces stellatus]
MKTTLASAAVCLLVAATSVAADVATHIHGRVVGGTAPKPDAVFPWMAGIRSVPGRAAYCAGTLIAPQYVLTAAQCFSFYRFTPDVFYVTIGSRSSLGTGDHVDNVTVASYTLHPGFIPYSPMGTSVGQQYDVAILKLSTPSTKTPIALGKDYIVPDTPATVLGWGQNNTSIPNPTFTTTLLQANASVLSDSDCQTRIRASNYSNFDKWNMTASHMCAGGVPGTGVCQNDAGAPLLVQSPVTGALVLVGDASFGASCASGVPDIYARLTGVRDFIDKYSSGHQWV